MSRGRTSRISERRDQGTQENGSGVRMGLVSRASPVHTASGEALTRRIVRPEPDGTIKALATILRHKPDCGILGGSPARWSRHGTKGTRTMEAQT
jgi:hypothetical protein